MNFTRIPLKIIEFFYFPKKNVCKGKFKILVAESSLWVSSTILQNTQLGSFNFVILILLLFINSAPNGRVQPRADRGFTRSVVSDSETKRMVKPLVASRLQHFVRRCYKFCYLFFFQLGF